MLEEILALVRNQSRTSEPASSGRSPLARRSLAKDVREHTIEKEIKKSIQARGDRVDDIYKSAGLADNNNESYLVSTEQGKLLVLAVPIDAPLEIAVAEINAQIKPQFEAREHQKTIPPKGI